jgi:hypothetical protein
VSPEIGLIFAPRDTYAALVRTPAPASVLTALRRPLLVAAVLGVSVAITATGRATPALVASTTLAWSYVVVLQLAIAVSVLARPAKRSIGLARAVDLFFAGHAPWSLFALIVAAWRPSSAGWPVWPLEAFAIVPAVLTVRIVAAFFSEVLALEARAAMRLTIAQQALTWTVFLAVNWAASAFTPRLFELGARL